VSAVATPLVDALAGFELAEPPRRGLIVAPQDRATLCACLELRRDYHRRAGWSTLGDVPDRYDEISAHLAVVRDDRVVATLRSTPYRRGVGFMLEHEFASLVDRPADLESTPSSLEVSGLATTVGDRAERLPDVMLLFRLWTRLAYATHATRAYFVVDDDLLANFDVLEGPVARFVRPLGPRKRLAGDSPSRAMWLDMVEAARRLPALAPSLEELLFR
jgi:hypothetical protein